MAIFSVRCRLAIFKEVQGGLLRAQHEALVMDVAGAGTRVIVVVDGAIHTLADVASLNVEDTNQQDVVI